MDLKKFSTANKKRCVEDFNHNLEDWSYDQLSNALAGEAGECCNKTKKIRRLLDGLAGNTENEQDLEQLKREAAEEAADTIIYADLLIQTLGFDTSDTVRTKFNKTSDKIGSEIKIGADGSRGAPSFVVGELLTEETAWDAIHAGYVITACDNDYVDFVRVRNGRVQTRNAGGEWADDYSIETECDWYADTSKLPFPWRVFATP